jgi:hypothetical protein
MMDLEKIVYKQWAEYGFFIVLMIGFLISVILPNDSFNYIIIFLFGMFCGRIISVRKGRGYYFPILLLISGFFVGYLIGGLIRFNRYIIILLFVFGIVLSQQLHERGYISF